MGKDAASLEDSRAIRQHLITDWGRLPSSIWEVNWSIKVTDLSQSYNDFQKEQAEKYGKEFSLSSAGSGKNTGLSRFPQDLCQFLIKFFSKEGETVIDPFTGHNSRMESCYKTNRHYIGFDISSQFMQWNREVRDKLYKENEGSMTPLTSTITLTETDSRDIDEYTEEDIADFCITSPPFYDVEYYGDEPGQLGRSKDYIGFIDSLRSVAKHCHRALKPGKFMAWEVNDFRRNGYFYTYHNDTIEIFRRVGFTLHDIIIVDYGSSFLQAFLSDVEHNKIMPKQHSYIIVGRKPILKNDPKREQTRERLLEEVKSQPKPTEPLNGQATML